jgi:hypothetical protein
VTALWGTVRQAFFALVLLLFSQFDSSSQNQQPIQSTGIRRDPQAISVIQQAIAAMGGPNASTQVQTIIAQGTTVPPPGAPDPAGNVTMEDVFAAQEHEFRDVFRSSSQSQSFVSGHGNPGLVSNGHARNFPAHMANSRVPIHLPIMVLGQLLAKTNCNVEFVGPATVGGQAAVQIHVHIDTDIVQQTLSVQDWYFDPVSGLPIHVEYRLPDAFNPVYFVSGAADLSDFRPVQGVMFPFRISSYRDGTLRNILTFSSISLNQPVSSTDFDLPTVVTQ